eukprot:TRINITY_DN102966_c0_g1_i1.p1 TRINITY_DN102966_c0_g1~~TRINITY_DN102966_c0_g1_i1.p1  ORF type:complete len:132 (+),score=6.69 TRINITY_DN102966_c0_g1_i1:184-579(+)
MSWRCADTPGALVKMLRRGSPAATPATLWICCPAIMSVEKMTDAEQAGADVDSAVGDSLAFLLYGAPLVMDTQPKPSKSPRPVRSSILQAAAGARPLSFCARSRGAYVSSESSGEGSAPFLLGFDSVTFTP